MAPYAVAGIDEIINRPYYEEIEENARPGCRPRYWNLNRDGSLNLPPHLRGVFIDFQQLYENLRYQRLQGMKPRRRSISGAVDEHGRAIYDVITRPAVMETKAVVMAAEIHPVAERSHEQKREMSKKRSHSVDLGQLNEYMKIFGEFFEDQADGGDSFELEELAFIC